MQAGTGRNRYAGWNLIVVWEAPTAPWRNVTLYDGFDFVQVKGDEQLVVGPLNFTGFKTPASGNVDANVTVWATEGDRGITGDYLALGGRQRSCTGLTKHHEDKAHPVDNFFNSSISNGGVDVPGGRRASATSLGSTSRPSTSRRARSQRGGRRVGVPGHESVTPTSSVGLGSAR